jgi:cytochrome c556
MRVAPLAALLLAALLGGCRDASPTPYRLVADVQQLMLFILEPAAEVYWDAVGTILDQETGTLEITPQDDEEWEQVASAAYMVAESGNLLMMQGRAMDDQAWISMSQALVETGRRAIAAAESKDPPAVFDAGAEIYYACTACHAAYAVETLRPNIIPTE